MENKNDQLINNALDLINRANESFCYEVWVPSLKRNVMFREINTSQQKRLIKSIIDSPIYNTEFIYTLKQVIEENCADKTVIVDNLTIIDKMFIAIAMRAVSTNDVLEFQIPISEEKNVQRAISLSKLLTDSKDKTNIPEPINLVDEKNIFSLNCSIPTIKTEYDLEKEKRDVLITEKPPQTPEQLRETIGDIFISELVKYVNSITININNTVNKIDFSGLSFDDRIKLFEKLPIKLIEKLLDYSNKIKEEIDKVVLIKFDVDVNGKVETIERRLTIDGNFFINS